MEDDCGSRQAAKHAKKTIAETQASYDNGNLPLDRQSAMAKLTGQDDRLDRLQQFGRVGTFSVPTRLGVRRKGTSR